MHTLDMRKAFDFNNTNRFGNFVALGVAAQSDNSISYNAGGFAVSSDMTFLYDLTNIIVSYPADKGTPAVKYLLQEAVFGIPTIQNVYPSGLKSIGQDILF